MKRCLVADVQPLSTLTLLAKVKNLFYQCLMIPFLIPFLVSRTAWCANWQTPDILLQLHQLEALSTNSLLACVTNTSQCMNKDMQCCKALSWHMYPTIEWYNILTHPRATVGRGSRGTCLYGGYLTVSLRLVVCVYKINKCEYLYNIEMTTMLQGKTTL